MAKKKRLTKAEQIAKIPIERIVKLAGKEGRKELEKYARTLISGYKRRVGAFIRHGLVSYAEISLEGSIPYRQQPIKNMTRNQLIMEIARYQKFFNDETSSVEGIKRVNREQDIRIFGTDSRGRPIRTMTQEERTRYWALYDEYLNQNPNSTSKYGSESVQQTLADALFSGDRDTGGTITEILNKVEQKLSEQLEAENVGSVPNVYSGRGPAR